MLSDIREGSVDCVVVKDLSRFGRNYIESGRYIEKIFPMLGMRFIAVNDGYDSLDEQYGNDMVIPFKNLINDAYCRDISVKIRSHMEVKRKNGECIGAFAAYGYLKDPEDKNHLVVDEYAADVVGDIFAMKLCGMNPKAIAEKLNCDGILTKEEYAMLREQYQAQADGIAESIASLEREKAGIRTGQADRREWIDALKGYKGVEALDRGLAAFLIDRIEVMDSDTLQVSYRFGREVEEMERLVMQCGKEAV